MIAFLLWASLSLLWAEQVGVGLQALSRYGLNLLIFPIAYASVKSRRDLILVLCALIGGAVIAAMFGIVAPPNPALIEEGTGRATGTIGDPNELAGALVIGVAIAVGFLLVRRRTPLGRVGALTAVALCTFGVFLSLSRGGLIALSSLLLAGAIFGGRWRRTMIAGLVVVATGGVFYFTQLASLPARERITTVGTGSGRTDIWKIGLRMLYDHPATGVGVGNFQSASPHYVLQPGATERAELIFAAVPRVAHNTYLGVASELGIVGFALFMVILVTCLGCMLAAARHWQRQGNASSEALARGVLLATLGMLVADFFISQMYTKLFWIMLALGPAILALARQSTDEDAAPAHDRVERVYL